MRVEVQSVFSQGLPIDRIYFPAKSSQIPNRAALPLVVLPPENRDIDEAKTLQLVDSMTRQSGTSDRTFKSALIWCVPDSGRQLCDEARKLLAWEDIQEEASELKLEELQRKQLTENQGKSKRDLREAVWRAYKTVMLLAKDNSIRSIDLGLVHSSADASLAGFIVHRLTQDGDISEGISPKFLVRNWSGAHKEWSTKAVKDAVFASPLFPRLLNGDLILPAPCVPHFLTSPVQFPQSTALPPPRRDTVPCRAARCSAIALPTSVYSSGNSVTILGITPPAIESKSGRLF